MITRGFSKGLIVTRGYGASVIISGITEIIKVNSYLKRLLAVRSEL